MHLDHVTIRTGDIAGTRAFFETVFDLTVGERPAAIRRIPGYWLYADGKPIVHIIGSQAAVSTGPPRLSITSASGSTTTQPSGPGSTGSPFPTRPWTLPTSASAGCFCARPAVRCLKHSFPNPFPHIPLEHENDDDIQ